MRMFITLSSDLALCVFHNCHACLRQWDFSCIDFCAMPSWSLATLQPPSCRCVLIAIIVAVPPSACRRLVAVVKTRANLTHTRCANIFSKPSWSYLANSYYSACYNNEFHSVWSTYIALAYTTYIRRSGVSATMNVKNSFATDLWACRLTTGVQSKLHR